MDSFHKVLGNYRAFVRLADAEAVLTKGDDFSSRLGDSGIFYNDSKKEKYLYFTGVQKGTAHVDFLLTDKNIIVNKDITQLILDIREYVEKVQKHNDEVDLNDEWKMHRCRNGERDAQGCKILAVIYNIDPDDGEKIKAGNIIQLSDYGDDVLIDLKKSFAEKNYLDTFDLETLIQAMRVAKTYL